MPELLVHFFKLRSVRSLDDSGIVETILVDQVDGVFFTDEGH